ncbi:unnamed protein product [Oreochromis niloticus]|nr:unnamed protein product [Mustela putorius furo]
MASPLFSDSEEAPELQVQTQPRHQAGTVSPDQEEPQCSAVVCKQEVEIELEVIPPIRKSKSHPAMTESEGSASETLVVKRTDSCQDGKSELILQPRICKDTKKSTVAPDTILRAFRQENVDPGLKTPIQVRRTDLLHDALEVLRRPDFCFRATPVISFSGEEPEGHKAPVREFFRSSSFP